MPPAAAPQPQQQQQHLQPRQQHHGHSQPSRSSSSRTVNPATGMPDRVGSYAIREEIGRGSFATVYRGEKVTTNPALTVAIKAVVRSKLTTKLLENLESEIRLLKGIKQRNVVELLDCLKTEAHIYLVMAYCSAGDLSQYIRKRGQIPSLTASAQQSYKDRYPHPRDGGLNELVVRCFLGQLSEALKFLRKQNIIHRDIKPQNLLLHPADARDIAAGHPPGIPHLRVADFGFARALPNTSLAETLCGSPLYMAPEILRYEKYDAKADLWSVGAVTYEMTVGKPPFRAQNHVELLRRIERSEDRIKFPDERAPEPGREEAPPTPVPEDLKTVIRSLLKRNPVERASFVDFFAQAEAVARYGEGSLVAPGTIDDGTATPSRTKATMAPTVEVRPSSGENAVVTAADRSGRASPQVGQTATPSDQAEPAIKPAAGTYIPPVPSSAEEQEMAFVRLPQNAVAGYSAGQSDAARTSPISNTSSQSRTQPAQAPALVQRRSTFKPKYIVGPSSTAESTARAAKCPDATTALKSKDYAVITTTAATPTAMSPVIPSRGHSRRQSQDSLGQGAPMPESESAQQPAQKSNLSLALPQTKGKATGYQKDLAASNLTGETGEDSVLGREYVVVEKRNVEVNALADEMAAVPRRRSSFSRQSSRAIFTRQTTGLGQSPGSPAGKTSYGPSGTDAQSPPSPALPYPPPAAHSTAYDHPPFAPPPSAGNVTPNGYGTSPRAQGGLSYGASARYSGGALAQTAQDQAYSSPLNLVAGIGFPGTAIGKAINFAALKVFGSPSENIWLRKRSHRYQFGTRRRPRSTALQDDRMSAQEDELLQKLEDIAQKAIAIFDFADSKLILMQPQTSQQSVASQSRPGSQETGGPSTGDPGVMGGSQANPFFANVTPANAGPVDRQPSPRLKNAPSGQGPSAPTSPSSGQPTSRPQTHDDLLPGETLVLYFKALDFLTNGIEQTKDFWSKVPDGFSASGDLNDYVQWFRARFNECFEKADFAKSRLTGDMPDSAMLAEKLIFDKALEMSRAAAVSELMGENAQECEIAYDTALWMLYAILDETMQDGEPVDEEDKVTVRNFVEQIKGRLAALRRKMTGSPVP